MTAPTVVSQPVSLTNGRDRQAGQSARITLIRPPIVIFPKSLSSYGPVPPIGLAYIAAALRGAGHQVSLIDGSGEAIDCWADFDTPAGRLRRVGLAADEIAERVAPTTQMVGITHMFLHEWPHVKEIAEAIRYRLPEVPIILGGENATSFHPWIFAQTDAVSGCVLGEGEATAVEVADRISQGVPLTGMKSLVTPPRPDADEPKGLPTRLRQLSEVHPPAWDLVPLRNYWKYSDFFGIHRGRSMPMLATRGCPYKCSFCSSPQMWTTRYVVRDPEDVVDEIERYVTKYEIKNVNFVDLTAVTKRQWTLDFCDTLERRGLDIEWQVPVGTRVEALDAEVLTRLWETGCRYVTFAPESGSKRMLEVYDKRVDIERIYQAVATCFEVGIRTRVNIIIGHPEERWIDQWASLRFLVRAAIAGCDDAAVIMFCPYPGSRDFTSLVDSGKHIIDEAAYYVGISRASSKHVSHNPVMSSRQLRTSQLVMAGIFYGVGLVRHPGRVREYVRAQRTGTENTFLDQLLRIKWRGFVERGDENEISDRATEERVEGVRS